MGAKEWLDKNEWENRPIESTAFSHHTTMDRIMEEYAKHYLTEHMKYLQRNIETKKKKFI